jgi:hypothetical protein
MVRSCPVLQHNIHRELIFPGRLAGSAALRGAFGPVGGGATVWGYAIEGGLTFLVTAGIAYLVGYMFVYATEHAVLRHDSERIETRFKQMQKLRQGMDARRRDLKPRIAELALTLKSGSRHQYLAMKKQLDLEDHHGMLVRTVGEEECRNPNKPSRKFIARIVNERVSRAVKSGEEHPSLSPDWARAQVVEVWAQSLVEARALGEKAYPTSLGFVIHNLVEAPTIVLQRAPDDAPEHAAADAAAQPAGAEGA